MALMPSSLPLPLYCSAMNFGFISIWASMPGLARCCSGIGGAGCWIPVCTASSFSAFCMLPSCWSWRLWIAFCSFATSSWFAIAYSRERSIDP